MALHQTQHVDACFDHGCRCFTREQLSKLGKHYLTSKCKVLRRVRTSRAASQPLLVELILDPHGSLTQKMLMELREKEVARLKRRREREAQQKAAGIEKPKCQRTRHSRPYPMAQSIPQQEPCEDGHREHTQSIDSLEQRCLVSYLQQSTLRLEEFPKNESIMVTRSSDTGSEGLAEASRILLQMQSS
jgi:hypothetical protein